MSQTEISLPKARRVCVREGCSRKGWKRGFCGRHYAEWYRQAYPERVAASVERRREATREYHRNYYLANRDKIAARMARRYASQDPEEKRVERRRWWVKSKYGLDVDEYEAIMVRGCAICGTDERICLDHDHTTGKVRDALCTRCNSAIGYMADDAARLRVAADYLETHRKGGDAK